jgi:uncharacterized protein YecT (DUF1311 family)
LRATLSSFIIAATLSNVHRVTMKNNAGRLSIVIAFLLLTLNANLVLAQTEEQRAENRRARDQWVAQRYRILDGAYAAWNREMAREEAGDCLEARTTYEINICIGEEVEITEKNYRAYADAFRALFTQVPPRGGGVGGSGPSGTPPTAEETLRRFNDAEDLWRKYMDASCELDADTWRGGTIAPYMGASCELKLFRNHMRDLGGTFGRSFR